MKRIIRLFGMWGVALGAVWLAGARRRARERGAPLRDVMSHDLRGFVTHRFNPLVIRLGLAGGRRSPWAIVEHVGRTSGTTYRTPILPMVTGAHAFIPLTYGMDVHWVKNVKAAGHCRIQLHETILELDEPAIIGASENPVVPPSLRGAMDRSGRKYLRLHVLERVPGTFVRRGPERAVEPAVGPAEIHLPALNMLHPAEQPSPEAVTA